MANRTDLTKTGPYVPVLRVIAFATLGLPFIALPGFLFPYIVPRAALFRVLMGAAIVLLLGALILRRNVPGRRDPILAAIVVFFFASLLSAFAGVAVYRSLYGNLERMWGVWGWFNVAALYVLLRTVLADDGWNRWLRASLWISGVIGVYALLQFLELRIPYMIPAPRRPHATLGNPAYLAVFLFLQVGLGLLLRIRDPQPGWTGRVDYAALLLASVAFLLANTRAVILGAVIGAVIAAGSLAITGTAVQRRRVLRLLGAGVIAAAGLLALVLAYPGAFSAVPGLNRLADLTSEYTNIRLIAWQVGLEGFSARPLVGWGMDNFGAIFDAGLTAEYFSTPVYDTGIDRVHNAYIELLATGGALGLLAFLAIFVAAAWLIVNGWRRQTLSRMECAVFAGLLGGYLTYLVFWFEDLSSLIALTALLALLGSRSSAIPLLRIDGPRAGLRTARWAAVSVITVLMAAALWMHAWKPLLASRALEQLDNATIGVRVPERLVETALAADLSRTHALTILTMHLRGLLPLMDGIRSDAQASAIVTRRLERTLIAIEREIARDPRNSQLQVHRASTLVVAAVLTRNADLYASALGAYGDAIRLSPNQVHHRYRLAEALSLTDRFDDALAQLDTAAAIAPAFGATDYFRARFLLQRDDVAGATGAARAAIAKGYVRDARMGVRLDDALAEAGQPVHFRIALLRAFLLERRGDAGLERPRANLADADRPLLQRLEGLLTQAGITTEAGRMRALVRADSAAAATAR